MPLAPGARLGPYEIAAPLGAGGMGEVYRATDTRLKRQVAIKVLPAELTADQDRLARFQREAELLASLNHPNIAAIYGLEDAGNVRALVLELVEGPTLADRIARGPLPIAEALPIGRQVADALESAHEQGVIHRDLKPANIKLRADGTAKVLDFGLAKALVQAPGSEDDTSAPTLTSPAQTARGTILGTTAYMSPEQARGKPGSTRTPPIPSSRLDSAGVSPVGVTRALRYSTGRRDSIRSRPFRCGRTRCASTWRIASTT